MTLVSHPLLYKQITFTVEDILLSFAVVKTKTTIFFADRIKHMSPNEMKCTVTIVNWPFSSHKNHLRVWSTIDALQKVYFVFLIDY